MPYTVKRHSAACIDQASTCHLQEIRSQFILLYEGKIFLKCLPNNISSPINLRYLEVMDIFQHASCDTTGEYIATIIHLCARVSDCFGNLHSAHADIPLRFRCRCEDLSNVQLKAFIKLIHAQAIADDVHQICAQIILNQTQLPCVCAAKKNLPIYPKLFCSRNGEFC